MARKKTKKSRKKTKKKKVEKGKIFRAMFSAGKVFSNSKEAFNLYDKARFGEPKQGKIFYSLVEALYLLENKKLEVYQKKKLNFDKFLKEAEKIDKKIHIKFIVFRDMRKRGYIVKTALKFGADFRVYEKGAKPGEKHAKWILYPVSEVGGLTWHEFSAKNRVAHSTKKNLLIAIVDDENDVSYYEIAWTRP